MTTRELSLDSLDLPYAGLRARRPMAEKRLIDPGRWVKSPVVVVMARPDLMVIDGQTGGLSLKRAW